MTSASKEQRKEEENAEEKKAPATKEKLRVIMEAASALTSLNEEDDKPDESSLSQKAQKRYIPENKKQDAALTFPEKLMHMMQFADKVKDKDTFCVAWLGDGKSFVVRDADKFTKTVVPKFFKKTKFSSFTRKLYRWGFRQVNRGIGPEDPIIFGNEFFQREQPELMIKMRSTTAAGTRKQTEVSRKRGLDDPDEVRKRMLLGWNKDMAVSAGAAGMNTQALQGGPFNLAAALRPGFGMPMNPLFFQQAQAAAPTPSSDQQQKQLAFFRNMQQQQQQALAAQQGANGIFLPPHSAAMLQQNQGTNNVSNNVLLPHMMMNANQNQNPGNGSGGQQAHLPAGVVPPIQGQFPGAASTAEIVNAAINALRYAS